MRAALALAALTTSANAAPKPCTRYANLDAVVAKGDTAQICVSGYSASERECWQLDAHGIAPLAKADWPAPMKELHGDRVTTEAKTVDYVDVAAPDGITIKVLDDLGKQVIEVCDAGKCRRLKPKQRHNLDEVRAVTVLPDRHTVFVGLGLAVVSAEQLVRFDLAKPDTGRLLGKCANVIDVIGGNVLVQKTDCANAGGPRMLFSPAGKILGVVGESFSSGAPSFRIGGDRWFFFGYNTFTVWDVAKGAPLATVPVCKP